MLNGPRIDAADVRAVVALLAALCPGFAMACTATLAWQQSTQNTDGSPATIIGNRVLWGSQPGSYPNSTLLSAVTGYVVGLLPDDGGTAYFVVTAISAKGESALSLPASKPCPAAPVFAPNVPTAFSLTFKPSAPVAVTITLLFDADPDSPLITIAGTAPVTIALDPPLNFDTIAGVASLGGNNDGVFASSVTLTGPISARADIDGPTPGTNGPFTGASATVAGVTKQFVQTGTTWKVAFP